MTQIVQEQQWQTWNRTHWSINIHSVVTCRLCLWGFIHRCALRCLCSVFCSLLTRQICQRAEWGLAVLATVWGRCWTRLWKQAGDCRFDLTFCLRCGWSTNCFVCVSGVVRLCARRERERAQKALCPWLRQRADSESSVTVMSCVFSLSPSTEWKACLWYQQLGQKDRSRWRKPCSGGERERWKV